MGAAAFISHPSIDQLVIPSVSPSVRFIGGEDGMAGFGLYITSVSSQFQTLMVDTILKARSSREKVSFRMLSDSQIMHICPRKVARSGAHWHKGSLVTLWVVLSSDIGCHQPF